MTLRKSTVEPRYKFVQICTTSAQTFVFLKQRGKVLLSTSPRRCTKHQNRRRFAHRHQTSDTSNQRPDHEYPKSEEELGLRFICHVYRRVSSYSEYEEYYIHILYSTHRAEYKMYRMCHVFNVVTS